MKNNQLEDCQLVELKKMLNRWAYPLLAIYEVFSQANFSSTSFNELSHREKSENLQILANKSYFLGANFESSACVSPLKSPEIAEDLPFFEDQRRPRQLSWPSKFQQISLRFSALKFLENLKDHLPDRIFSALKEVTFSSQQHLERNDSFFINMILACSEISESSDLHPDYCKFICKHITGRIPKGVTNFFERANDEEIKSHPNYQVVLGWLLKNDKETIKKFETALSTDIILLYFNLFQS